MERVELDGDLLAEVRRLVGAEGVRAFVERAARHELERHELSELLARIESEIGPVPDDLLTEAEAFWRTG